MPTEIKANELRDVDVSFVSLVKRGANRIPFRLTKKDGNMIDFNRIFFRKADEAEKAVIVKDAVEASAVVLGTMPIPTTPEAAVEAATALLKQNGYNVMLAQADSVAAQPDAKSANAADDSKASDKPAADAKAADKPVAGADKPKDKTVAAKKAEIEKLQAELVELEKGAAQKSNPASAPAVNAGKDVNSGKGAASASGEPGIHNEPEEISEDPTIEGHNEEKKKTMALMAKLEETVAGLAELVKASTEATEKRLGAVEASVKKSDAVITQKVLGAAQDDAAPVHARKAASSAPPLLDTGLTTANRFS